jgi:hypothetical protein
MKSLTVYYSASGPTGKNGLMAVDLHKKIGGDIEQMREDCVRSGGWSIFKGIIESVSGKYGDLKPMKTKPEDYDLVIVATPIWAGKIPPPIRTYLRDNKDKFKKIALLSVSGSGNKNAATVLPDFEKRAGTKLVASLLVSESEFTSNSYEDDFSGFIEILLER